MRDGHFTQLCGCKFEEHISEMFAAGKARAIVRGEKSARAPYIDWPYCVYDENRIARLKGLVCAALTAQKWFEEHKPRWAPLLPLSVADCEKLESAGSSRLKLVSYYGRSQMASKWDKRHPSFADHACGVMASPSAPDHLRKDPGLMAEFRPRPLEGLDWFLCWNRPERVVELRQQLIRRRQYLRSRGMPRTSLWMQTADQLIAGLDACCPSKFTT
jgi:hypothetical protein